MLWYLGERCSSHGDGDYDLAIIPPEPSGVTNEEGADEGMISDSLPRDVPGNIKVFRSNENNISRENYSSDDEPLAGKSKRICRQQPDDPLWRKCSPSYSTTAPESTNVANNKDTAKSQLEILVQIFEKNI